MTEPCAICGGSGAVGIDVTDESGGSFGALCETCLGLIGAERCGLCGDPEPVWGKGRNGTVHARDEGETTAGICPDCRFSILEGVHEGKPVQAQAGRAGRWGVS